MRELQRLARAAEARADADAAIAAQLRGEVQELSARRSGGTGPFAGTALTDTAFADAADGADLSGVSAPAALKEVQERV